MPTLVIVAACSMLWVLLRAILVPAPKPEVTDQLPSDERKMLERALITCTGKDLETKVDPIVDYFVKRDFVVVAYDGFESANASEEGLYFVVDGLGASSIKSDEAFVAQFSDLELQISTGDEVAPHLARLDIQLRSERTLVIIKPDAAPRAREVLDYLKKYGFTVISLKKQKLTLGAAQEFYIEHDGRPFFERLTKFMSSGVLFVAAVERVGAIKGWRQLLGPTNTAVARKERPNSVRGLFGTDQTRNACHGSDSAESAERELGFFFPELTESVGTAWSGTTNFEAIIKDILYNKGPAVDGGMAGGKLPANESLAEVLSRGLKELYELKPENPVEWLGKFLVDNGEYKAKVPAVEAEVVLPKAAGQEEKKAEE